MPTKTTHPSPLHLLRSLTEALLKHQEKACAKALVKAERKLARHETGVAEASEKLEAARKDGDPDLLDKRQRRLDKARERRHQSSTYLERLRQQIDQSLVIAQGLAQVRQAAEQAIAAAGAPPQPAGEATAASPSQPAASNPVKKPTASRARAPRPSKAQTSA